jgi:dinuclear metal center YbgI/SA1388 family protein
MQIKEIIATIEQVAPPKYQESYDNAGLLFGSADWECTGVLICLDAIEAVIEDAIERKCNLVLAHHPIIFTGLKKINGKNYIERVVIKAIQNNIAIYAAHTNLDNVAEGVNKKICDTLGLIDTKILLPKENLLKKLYTYVPESHKDEVLKSLFEAGAGNIGNYDQCSFSADGIGTFRGNDDATPFVGVKNQLHFEKESKIEVIFNKNLQSNIIKALLAAHPYEEVAYDIIALENSNYSVGSGMYGVLPQPMEEIAFLNYLKEKMQTNCIRYTKLQNKKIHKIALCGGAGSFLLPQAIAIQADIFITADYKYHQFFDADNQIIIADIGHFESEQYTIQLFYDILHKKFPTFALHLTKINTNPINYL